MRILRTLDPLGGPILLSLVVALALVPSATAYEVPSKLNEVAHVYSLGAGEMGCPSRAEWDQDWAPSFGWAYTNVREDYTVLGPVVCRGALSGAPTFLPGSKRSAPWFSRTRRSTFATGASGGTRGRWSARPSPTSGTPRDA